LKTTLKKRTTFKGLNKITNYIKDFFLKTRVKVKVEITTRVFKTIKITGILKLIIIIIRAVEIKAINNV